MVLGVLGVDIALSLYRTTWLEYFFCLLIGSRQPIRRQLLKCDRLSIERNLSLSLFAIWTVAEMIRAPSPRSNWVRTPPLVTADVGPYQTALDLPPTVVESIEPSLCVGQIKQKTREWQLRRETCSTLVPLGSRGCLPIGGWLGGSLPNFLECDLWGGLESPSTGRWDLSQSSEVPKDSFR